jgi:hypothetical protein
MTAAAVFEPLSGPGPSARDCGALIRQYPLPRRAQVRRALADGLAIRALDPRVPDALAAWAAGEAAAILAGERG